MLDRPMQLHARKHDCRAFGVLVDAYAGGMTSFTHGTRSELIHRQTRAVREAASCRPPTSN